jgi:hypothetical protein
MAPSASWTLKNATNQNLITWKKSRNPSAELVQSFLVAFVFGCSVCEVYTFGHALASLRLRKLHWCLLPFTLPWGFSPGLASYLLPLIMASNISLHSRRRTQVVCVVKLLEITSTLSSLSCSSPGLYLILCKLLNIPSETRPPSKHKHRWFEGREECRFAGDGKFD